MKLNSIRFKISVLYVVILGVVLIFYSGFLYLSLRYTLYDELDNELNKKTQELANMIDSYANALGGNQEAFNLALKKVIIMEGKYPERYKIPELEQQWLQKVNKFDLKEDYINFMNMGGKSLIKSNNFQSDLLVLLPKEAKNISEGEPVFKNIKFEKRNLRVISAPFFYGENEKFIIQIGTSVKPVVHLLQVRLIHIFISIPIILILASFLGRLFSSRILMPVAEITSTARNITHEDLSLRVKAEHVDQEMKNLVDAFNNMISRLEKSFKYIAEFSSHVAHELKTPLAIIRGEADIALRKERSPEEYKRVIKVNLEEAGRMLKVIEDLLLLTKLDYRPEFFKFEMFDLTDFFQEIYEQSKILASRKSIQVSINMAGDRILMEGDRLHLRRLFFNLIDNSIKFTPKKGQIKIDVRKTDRKVVADISDTGIGITEGNLPKVFDKFFHVDRTSDQISHSAGLGLSIADSIARFHEGNISVKSIPEKGSTFTVSLPLQRLL